MTMLKKMIRERASQLLTRLAAEDGQEMTEYAITTFALLIGSTVSLLVFLPNAIAAYKIYILGFYMVLGLPIP